MKRTVQKKTRHPESSRILNKHNSSLQINSLFLILQMKVKVLKLTNREGRSGTMKKDTKERKQ